MFIPAASEYHPLAEGLGNRVNAVPAVGLVCMTFGVYMIFGVLVGHALQYVRGIATRIAVNGGPLGASTAATLGIILALLTGARWAHLQNTDATAWNLASKHQLQALDRIRKLAPHPSHNELLLVFGGPAFTLSGVPVFAATWDLNGAVEIYYDDFTLTAFPIINGVGLRCMANGMASVGYGPSGIFPYGKTTLIDIEADRVSRPEDQSQCAAALPVFRPGPLTILAPPLI